MKPITVSVIVHTDKRTAWHHYNSPESIMMWAFGSNDWEAPYAENDLKVGGKFLTKMSAKDGSASFNFTGTYTKIIPLEKIEYTIDDGRKVEVVFDDANEEDVKVTVTFEPETVNPENMQRDGWQAMLNNFKTFVERQ